MNAPLKVYEVTGKEKLSTLLLYYATPFLDAAGDSEDKIEAAVTLAILYWNIGNYPGEISYELQGNLISELIRESDPDEKLEDDLLQFTSEMITVRRTVFGADNRYIIDHEITWNSNAYNLRVFSSTIPPELFDIISETTLEEEKFKLMNNQNT